MIEDGLFDAHVYPLARLIAGRRRDRGAHSELGGRPRRCRTRRARAGARTMSRRLNVGTSGARAASSMIPSTNWRSGAPFMGPRPSRAPAGAGRLSSPCAPVETTQEPRVNRSCADPPVRPAPVATMAARASEQGDCGAARHFGQNCAKANDPGLGETPPTGGASSRRGSRNVAPSVRHGPHGPL